MVIVGQTKKDGKFNTHYKNKREEDDRHFKECTKQSFGNPIIGLNFS